MITPRATLIRDGRATHVYRPYVRFGRFATVTYTVRDGTPMCHSCGCTERLGCWQGCGWANREQTICSRCVERIIK